MCWCSYLSEGSLCVVDLPHSPDGHGNNRGEGHDPAQTVGPVWVRFAPAGCQGLVVQEVADEANLEEKQRNKEELQWTNSRR